MDYPTLYRPLDWTPNRSRVQAHRLTADDGRRVSHARTPAPDAAMLGRERAGRLGPRVPDSPERVAHPHMHH